MKALAAGTEPVASLALKVSVRAVPLTAAEASVGAAGAPWTLITRERAMGVGTPGGELGISGEDGVGNAPVRGLAIVLVVRIREARSGEVVVAGTV